MSHIESLIGLLQETAMSNTSPAFSQLGIPSFGRIGALDGASTPQSNDYGGRLLTCGRPSSPKPSNGSNQVGPVMATRSDIYGRPDVYDMEYEGADNQDARFFARLLARVGPRRVDEILPPSDCLRARRLWPDR